MMDHRDEMQKGMQLAEDGDIRSAYLTFREAAVEAEAASDFEWAMRGLAGALACFEEQKLGGLHRKLELLLELRRLVNDHPDSAFEIGDEPIAGYVTNVYFEHLLTVSPDREALEDCLSKLEDSSPAHYLYRAKAEYKYLRGEWASALELAELARSSSGEDSNGHKVIVPRLAFKSALASGRREDCKSWITAMDKDLAKNSCNHCKKLVLRSKLELALSRQDAQEVLNRDLDALNSVQMIGDPPSETDHLAVRIQILDESNGSLDSPSHPARRNLAMRKTVDAQSICSLWERSLSVLRFRLASVCWSFGFRPVDDYSSLRIVDLPTYDPGRSVSREKQQILLSKAEKAVRKAEFAARILDERLGCNWRQEKVRVFSERVQEFRGMHTGR